MSTFLHLVKSFQQEKYDDFCEAIHELPPGDLRRLVDFFNFNLENLIQTNNLSVFKSCLAWLGNHDETRYWYDYCTSFHAKIGKPHIVKRNLAYLDFLSCLDAGVNKEYKQIANDLVTWPAGWCYYSDRIFKKISLHDKMIFIQASLLSPRIEQHDFMKIPVDVMEGLKLYHHQPEQHWVGNHFKLMTFTTEDSITDGKVVNLLHWFEQYGMPLSLRQFSNLNEEMFSHRYPLIMKYLSSLFSPEDIQKKIFNVMLAKKKSFTELEESINNKSLSGMVAHGHAIDANQHLNQKAVNASMHNLAHDIEFLTSYLGEKKMGNKNKL